MRKWWWVVALGTLALGFVVGAFTGPGWMGGGRYAKPVPNNYGPGNGYAGSGYMMNYMHDQSNWDDMARMMASPENRDAMVNIMSSPEMRRSMVDMMQQPEMRQAMVDMMRDREMQQAMADIMSDPKARASFVNMMALPAMDGVIGDMAGDARVRPVMERKLSER